MCLITFAIQKHSLYPFILIANRDEFYDRPTAKATFWDDAPEILAGRDLKSKGTWLGITKKGKIAAITNYRNPSLPETGKYSRGKIPVDFLNNEIDSTHFLSDLEQDKSLYSGYNALFGNYQKLYTYNNIYNSSEQLDSGIHSLSNDKLNTPWPKVLKAKDLLQSYLEKNQNISSESLFHILKNADKPSDQYLPDTGVGIHLERNLSSMFIDTGNYGTRTSTIILVDKKSNVTFIERTYHQGKAIGDINYHFSIVSD
ncbi:NRDE family protein [Oceanobacillus kimchii]|uniref:NRDE family protein n=1 Tax=Oceanobacillus kimchii TaxID=746691 RepID=UPI000987B104|nr:NRDE family protein [Oceanobacillus kimchii]MCT1578558.1 NRDE family protein [Oceanobacillus kimchii]MCT2136393.1 NRDE family protein [Oceanobacillus kimchii]